MVWPHVGSQTQEWGRLLGVLLPCRRLTPDLEQPCACKRSHQKCDLLLQRKFRLLRDRDRTRIRRGCHDSKMGEMQGKNSEEMLSNMGLGVGLKGWGTTGRRQGRGPRNVNQHGAEGWPEGLGDNGREAGEGAKKC